MSAQRLVLPFDGDTRWHDLGCDLRIAAGSDVPILITGDRDASRLVARAIHDRNPRRRSAGFLIGCHDTLFETFASLSTRFRSTHGSPTQSTADDVFATLYIDRVEELTPDAQEMLMYFLDVTQGSEAVDPQARVVVATNENLPDRPTAGLFREDLFYRLNLVHLTMPRVLGAGDTQLDALLASLSDTTALAERY